MFAAALFAQSFLMSALEFSRGRKAGQLLFDCGVQGQHYLQWLLARAVAVQEAATLIPHHCAWLGWQMHEAAPCKLYVYLWSVTGSNFHTRYTWASTLSSVYNHFYLCLFKYKGWLVPEIKQAQCKQHEKSCRVSVAENYLRYLTGKLSKRREKFRMDFSL